VVCLWLFCTRRKNWTILLLSTSRKSLYLVNFMYQKKEAGRLCLVVERNHFKSAHIEKSTAQSCTETSNYVSNQHFYRAKKYNEMLDSVGRCLTSPAFKNTYSNPCVCVCVRACVRACVCVCVSLLKTSAYFIRRLSCLVC
jgi:hypothetical protein